MKKKDPRNRQKLFELFLLHKTGIYQNLIPGITGLGIMTVSNLLSEMKDERLIEKERHGSTNRIIPNTAAILQKMQKNEINAKPLIIERANPVTIQPDRTIIEIFPDEFWTIRYSPSPLKNNEQNTEYGLEYPETNWSCNMDNLFCHIPEELIDAGIALLKQNMENGNKLNLDELLKICHVLPENTTAFLVILAVCLNDENARKARNNCAGAKIIKKIIIKNINFGKYINTETELIT